MKVPFFLVQYWFAGTVRDYAYCDDMRHVVPRISTYLQDTKGPATELKFKGKSK